MKDYAKVMIVMFAMVILLFGYFEFVKEPMTTYQPSETPTATLQPVGECRGLASTPVLTLSTPDKYNLGSAVTTKLMYRIIGTDTWTDIAGTGTITKSAGTQLQIVCGINSTDDDAEPYGPELTYIMPCTETVTLSIPVSNDAAATDLTGTYFDKYGQPNTAHTGWSAGDIETFFISFAGKYEHDFGNINCGEQANLLIAKYNTTQVDKVDMTGIQRITGTTKSYNVKQVTVPTGIAGSLSASNFALKAWEFPVIESNGEYKATYVLDGDDTVAVNTTLSAFTWYLYDGTMYHDANDNIVKCGWEDEDQNEIGATAADSITPSITP